MPDFELEIAAGGLVCGLDEVGRGPLAGPVVAACVHIPAELRALPFVPEIRDSKKLSRTKLARLNTLISQHFVWSIAEISPAEIDEINILQASLKAMREAFLSLETSLRGGFADEAIQSSTVRDRWIAALPTEARNDDLKEIHALVDGNRCPDLPCSAQPVVKGDGKSVSIAAASILAKVHRDRIMEKLAQEHPHYGWERNVGYPTKGHMEAIDAHGITPHHRKSFAPVRNFLEFGAVKKRA